MEKMRRDSGPARGRLRTNDRGQARREGLLGKGCGDTGSATDSTTLVFSMERQLRIQTDETGRLIRTRAGITHTHTHPPSPRRLGDQTPRRVPGPGPLRSPAHHQPWPNTWPPRPRAAGPQ